MLLNTQATPVMIDREKKLAYAVPLNKDCQKMENLKKFKVTECLLYANPECKLRRKNVFPKSVFREV